MRVLVVNAGSTSLKLRVVGPHDRVDVAEDLEPGDGEALAEFVGRVGDIDAVGHRVVHGGPRFVAPVVVTAEVRRELEELDELAPLHNPPAVQAIEQVAGALPGPPVVACFDTAFHASLPEEAFRYALPAEWVERWGVRRYGFHGLSCEWALARAAAMLGRPAADLRMAICHLGGGASVTAVAGGRSVDTSMGFTPAEGLVMATRSGDVDPGALAWLLEQGIAPEELGRALEQRSGLLALSGGETGDMRVLLERRRAANPVATGAVAVFLHRLAAEVAAMAAASGGLDALVFTGGIGEHSGEVRAETAERLRWMGVVVDPSANQAVGSDDLDISADDSRVAVLVVRAREELVVADHCRRLLRPG